MDSEDHLGRVIATMAAAHAEHKQPVSMTWKDLRFDAVPTRKVQQYLVKMLKKKHNLLLLCFIRPLPNGMELSVLTEEEFTAVGGVLIPNEQMVGIAAMLDHDPKDMADFLVQRTEGKLKGNPQPED